MRQCFVDSNNLSTPKFSYAPIFLHILTAPMILCILPAPIFLYAPIICWRQYFKVFSVKDDYSIVVMIMNCVCHDYY
jgi:hypothetical protein